MTNLNSQEEIDSHYDNFDYEVLVCVGKECGVGGGEKPEPNCQSLYYCL